MTTFKVYPLLMFLNVYAEMYMPCGSVQLTLDLYCFYRDSFGGFGRTAGSTESHW